MAVKPLIAFWIVPPRRLGPLGFGVTAHGRDDALRIIRESGYADYLPPDVVSLKIVEGVRYDELEENHVPRQYGADRGAGVVVSLRTGRAATPTRVAADSGRTAVGRGGASILSNAGLLDLIAQTPKQYVEIAIEWATDLTRLAALRASCGHGCWLRRFSTAGSTPPKLRERFGRCGRPGAADEDKTRPCANTIEKSRTGRPKPRADAATGEVATLPDIGPAAAGAALEGESLAGGIGVGRRRVVNDGAEVKEVVLGGGSIYGPDRTRTADSDAGVRPRAACLAGSTRSTSIRSVRWTRLPATARTSGNSDLRDASDNVAETERIC